MDNNDNKEVASSKQEEKKGSIIPTFLMAKELYSEIVEMLDFFKFIILICLKLCRFGLAILIQILPSLKQYVEFLISILSCIYKEGFFCFEKAFYMNYQIRSFYLKLYKSIYQYLKTWKIYWKQKNGSLINWKTKKGICTIQLFNIKEL